MRKELRRLPLVPILSPEIGARGNGNRGGIVLVEGDHAIMSTAAKEVTISNVLGLHARPAMQFVDLANQFGSNIVVFKQGEEACEVDGKSVMQMITLEASAGTRLRICADGDDAEAAVQQLSELIENKFGED